MSKPCQAIAIRQGKTLPEGFFCCPKPGLEGGACQLVSLTCWGIATVWSVTELSPAQLAAVAESERGLRIGARVRLMRLALGIALGRQPLHYGGPPPGENPSLRHNTVSWGFDGG